MLKTADRFRSRATLALLWLVGIVVGCGKQNSTTTVSNSDSASPTVIVTHDTVRTSDTVTVGRDSSAAIALGDVSNWKTYRNDRYHFEFKYPPDLSISEKFSTVDILPKTWRAMATPDEPGHAVISVPIIHMGNRTAYPRFYDVEFRVGVADSLADCRAGNDEKTIGPIVINGSTFNQFEFSDAATMKYISGISYRTGHDGRCYAVEQIRAGSNYRDQPSKSDIDQNKLDEYYYLAGKIVKTFRFTDGR